MRPTTTSFLAPTILFCAVFGFSAGSAIASPQAAVGEPSGEPAESEVFFEVVDVEIVNIDVWVTDRKGQPVSGLGKDDFEVYRDGSPIDIANFYAVSDGRSVAPETPSPPEPGPDPGSGPPAAPSALELAANPPLIEPEHRLWLIVYLDNYNIDPIERNRILPALEIFLGRALRRGDQAMVVSYNRSLDVLQPFTDRLPLLLSSLEESQKYAGQATIRERDQMATLKRIDESRSPSQALLHARRYAEELMNSVDYTVDALERLIDSLGGLPGRKALIHVSSGVPMLAGEEMFHAVVDKFRMTEAYSEIPRHDTSRRFDRIAEYANAQRVVFHTLDAGGLKGVEFGSAEYAGFVNPRFRLTLETIVPDNLQSSLRLMAHETGGLAILNRNEVLPALDDVARDFRSFYSLGISSSGAEAGEYHEIKVKLRERPKGHRLRHRSGYRSKPLGTRVNEGLRSALLYSHQDNPLDVEVSWGRPERHGSGDRYLVPIKLQIPLRELVLLPVGAEKHEVRLKLFVGAVGKGGTVSDIDESPLGLRLANEHVEAAKGESFLHTHQLLLSRGRKKVGVAVLDVFGRQSSVVTAFIDVGPPLETEPELELDLGLGSRPRGPSRP